MVKPVGRAREPEGAAVFFSAMIRFRFRCKKDQPIKFLFFRPLHHYKERLQFVEFMYFMKIPFSLFHEFHEYSAFLTIHEIHENPTRFLAESIDPGIKEIKTFGFQDGLEFI